MKEILFYNLYYAALREPKTKSPLIIDSKTQDEIIQIMKKSGLNVVDYEIDISDYKRYKGNVAYHKYHNYHGGGLSEIFVEKSLEHYLAAKMMNLRNDDIYIDVASADSPAAEIYHKLYGCKVYRQDLVFPAGIHGNVIGGDASNMPVDDGFATKMALHCSFEMFEQDSDIRFIREAGRVLRKGGKLCILPLFIFNKYALGTDPSALPKGGIPFENDATLYCAKGSGYRHIRYYDVPHFIERIGGNLGNLELTIYVVRNEKAIDLSCNIKFIALFVKQ